MVEELMEAIDRPTRPLPRKYVEMIILLAQRMAMKDRIIPVPKPRMVDVISEAVGLDEEHMKRWHHGVDENKACEQLNLETAKRGALVVMTLVLKTDTTGGDAAKAYFSSVRKKLNADPVRVPADLEEHKGLAMLYLKG